MKIDLWKNGDIALAAENGFEAEALKQWVEKYGDKPVQLRLNSSNDLNGANEATLVFCWERPPYVPEEKLPEAKLHDEKLAKLAFGKKTIDWFGK